MILQTTAPASAVDFCAFALTDSAAAEAAPSLPHPDIVEPAQPSRSGAAAKPWKRRDHLGKFRLYIPPEKRKGFPNRPASQSYDSRGWRITRPEISANVKNAVQRLMVQTGPHRFVNQVSALALRIMAKDAPLGAHYICEGVDASASPWSTYNPIRLGRVGGPDIVPDEEPKDAPAGEWLPDRVRRFAKQYTADRRWQGVPVHKGARPFAPVRHAKPDDWIPPYREPEHVEPDDVLGNLETLSRLARRAKASDEGDRVIWQRRARAWRWWRDFRYPNAGSDLSYYDDGDKRDEDRLMYVAPDIGELMRAAGWTGSEKAGWNTRLAEQPMLHYVGEDRDRTWGISVGDLMFGAFHEGGYKRGDRNKVGPWTSFPKVGLLSFGTTEKGTMLYPRERLRQHQPGTVTIDGRKWPRPKYQKRWQSELRSYLGLSGAVPYFAEPHQRQPIRPPHTPTDITGEPCHIGLEPWPALLPERPPAGKVRGGRFGVEAARAYLEMIGVDGSVPLAQARANAGLPALPEKPVQSHADRYAEFEARLVRYRAGENVRLVEPRDLGDAIILGVGKDGTVDTKVWRGGVMPLPTSKPARIDPDGWIIAAMARTQEEDSIRFLPSNDMDRGGNDDVTEMGEPDLLEAIGKNTVKVLDMCIGDATAAEIAEKVFGLEPTYAAKVGGKRVDSALDELADYLWPVVKKSRTTVPANDNTKKDEKIAA